MPRINLSWDAVTGAAGYNVHAGPSPGLYTEMHDAGNSTSGYVDVPAAGTWYVAVAAYDAAGYEGEYSAEQEVNVTAGSPPTGVPVLSVE